MDDGIETLRKRIAEQADAQGADGWTEIAVPMPVSPSGRLRVPRGAFEMWAVARSNGGHLTPGWNPVSPPGLKQGGDDPYHTDWMLGAGLGLRAMKDDEALSEAAYAAKAEVERRLLGFDCSVLLQGPDVRGRVWQPKSPSEEHPGPDEDGLPRVMVVRAASAGWLEHASRTFSEGGAVIVETGGEMAHLVTVLREGAAGPMVRVEKARSAYPPESVVQVSPAAGRAELVEDDRSFRTAVTQASLQASLTLAAVASRPESTSSPERKPAARPSAGEPPYGLTDDPKAVSRAFRNTQYLHPVMRKDRGSYRIHMTLHSNDYASLTEGRPDRGALMIMVSRSGERLRTFATSYREWATGEMSDAAFEALYALDPDERDAPIRALEARLAERRRIEAERRAGFEALSTESLIEAVREIGEEELTLVEDFEDGCLDMDDLREIRNDYEDRFRIAEETTFDRGVELDTQSMRPILAIPAPNAYRPYDRDEGLGASGAAPGP